MQYQSTAGSPSSIDGVGRLSVGPTPLGLGKGRPGFYWATFPLTGRAIVSPAIKLATKVRSLYSSLTSTLVRSLRSLTRLLLNSLARVCSFVVMGSLTSSLTFLGARLERIADVLTSIDL